MSFTPNNEIEILDNNYKVSKDEIELLAPAGDLERLRIAILYGADAVYVGGKSFGLRTAAKNFTYEDLAEGVSFAHEHGSKLYVTVNIFAHEDDLGEELDAHLIKLHEIGIDAVIISDFGIFRRCRKLVPDLEVHVSTQANNTNSETALFWYEQGAKRVVLARELSFEEISKVHTNIEKELGEKSSEYSLEAFVHGAMCISYSGRCLLSSYLTGKCSERDSNRGSCSQPCRWKYHLVEETRPGEYYPIYEDERGTYIMNSKDLCMINGIDELVESGVRSFKVEGRMKTLYYVAVTIKAYREAIDTYFQDKNLYKKNLPIYLEEIRKVSHRDFTNGFYFGKTNEEDQVYETNSYIKDWDFVGVVLDYDEKTGYAKIEQRNKFVKGEKIHFMRPHGRGFYQTINEIKTEKGEIVDSAPHPQQILYIETDCRVCKFDILRKEIDK